jgi:hypothetical protein
MLPFTSLQVRYVRAHLMTLAGGTSPAVTATIISA